MVEERRIRILTLLRLSKQNLGEVESLTGGAEKTAETLDLYAAVATARAELIRISELPLLRQPAVAIAVSGPCASLLASGELRWEIGPDGPRLVAVVGA